MVLSEQEMVSALRASRSQTHGETRRTGAAYSDIRRAVERRELAHDMGVVNEFADGGHTLPTDAGAGGHDGHANAETAATFLLGDFYRSIVRRGGVIAVRMVVTRPVTMIIHMTLVVVGLQYL
ncbi:hypothetical protein [Sinorhizobium sp. GL28]|uniref:hypothetical protein n=1 Tax=Sinorhizobium sp. GL28 TaxID=1358418 RepID=UPI00071DAB51|nr:hypothetical protein [Sinorhizobium sp. GL28]